MRLIDADAFAKFITVAIERNHYDTLPISSYMTVKDVLEAVIDELNGNSIDGFENAPTIDAVPVVRCKDCRWHWDEQPGMVYCPATVGGWVENDWFCKGGERKGGDGNG